MNENELLKLTEKIGGLEKQTRAIKYILLSVSLLFLVGFFVAGIQISRLVFFVSEFGYSVSESVSEFGSSVSELIDDLKSALGF